MNKTIIMLKPDAYERELRDIILEELLDYTKMEAIARKYIWLSRTELEIIYNHNIGKDFWEDFVEYMTRRPIEMFLVQAKNVLENANYIIGPTKPEDDKAKKTIRGKHGIPSYMQKGKHIENLVHSSYDRKAFEIEKEVMLWWKKAYIL